MTPLFSRGPEHNWNSQAGSATAPSARSAFATTRSASSDSGPLKRERVRRVRGKPHIDLGWLRQDDRHGLRMDRRNNCVRLCYQEAEQLMPADWRAIARHASALPCPRERQATHSLIGRLRAAFLLAAPVL